MDATYTVSVLDFGAVPDSREFQDGAIQAAIDCCFTRGGGTVEVPAGVYPVRAMRLRSGVTLLLRSGAVLKASRNPEDYFILKNDTLEPVNPAELERNADTDKTIKPYGLRWHNAVIRAFDAENIAVIGEPGAMIDGCNCYDEQGEEGYRGPHAFSIHRCRHVVLRGYTIRNSANWAHSTWESRNILVEDVTVEGGHDGVHFRGCDDVVVRRCRLYTGDDCVAGFNNRNVLVEDCELNTACSAFRFGGTNVLVHHCHIFAPARFLFRGSLTKEEKQAGINGTNAAEDKNHRYNMLSLFTYFADFTQKVRYPASNIVIRDCRVEGADRFLHFNYSGNEIWQLNEPLADIRFENIEATGISMPLTAYGDTEKPASVTFENVRFSMRPGFEDVPFMHMANCREVCFDNVEVENSRSRHLVKCWSDPASCRFTFRKVTAPMAPEDYVVRTDEPFVCTPI